MNETELKRTLSDLREEQNSLSFQTAPGLLPVMLKYIGSTDPELRDDLIYFTFAKWIYEQRLIPAEHLHTILKQVLDDQHMFYHIDEIEGNGVFTRSFSVLLLPLLLGVHRDQSYLSEQEINEIKIKLFRFLSLEKDKRGFVEKKGWAHAIAHAADALSELAFCVEIGKQDLLEILFNIRSVVGDPEVVYSYGEEERLVTAVFSILQRDLLYGDEFKDWLQSFTNLVLAETRIPQKYNLRTNIKNFLHALYFRLLWEKKLDPYREIMENTLHAINPFAKLDNELAF